jgi:bacillithiol biosynthesis deacetylase BshB1
VGGTVHKLVEAGRTVVLADLTRGELATRGTPEVRAVEAGAAAKVLGVAERVNLVLPDGRLENSLAARTAVIEVIREYRPVVVLCHHMNDLHPDHAAAGSLLRSCLYPGGFQKYPARGEPYRPHAVLFYMTHHPFEPSFIVDTSGHFEAKRAAIMCYASQLHDPESSEPATRVASPDLIQQVEARDRYFGSLIEKTHGEPFVLLQHLPMNDVVEHFVPFPMT